MRDSKITEKDITDVWCEPIGGGMYQTGNCYHGEEFKKDLIKALKEYYERDKI